METKEGRFWPFVGIPSFLRAPVCADLDQLDAAIAVLGVPTDEGSPFMAGSRFAPRALREQSLRFAWGGAGYYDPESKKEYLKAEMGHGMIVDVGDAEIWPTNTTRTFSNITATMRKIIDRGALPVILGGDHSITYPLVRAFTRPLHVIQLDAHTDFAPFVDDLRFTNGHAFRHISKMPTVRSLNQVGIRSLRTSQDSVDDSLADGNRIVTMNEFLRLGPTGVAELLPENEDCYVSIDVDVLDISLVPGCVSAEPNGMSYVSLRDTLSAIAKRCAVVGFDFVEVNPKLDVGTGVTSYIGAHIIVEFLGSICAEPRWIRHCDSWLANRGKTVSLTNRSVKV